MPKVKVLVSVGGIGAWKAQATKMLVACPHVGDFIMLGDAVVHCDKVCIGDDVVLVEETVHFQSEEDAKSYERLMRAK